MGVKVSKGEQRCEEAGELHLKRRAEHALVALGYP